MIFYQDRVIIPEVNDVILSGGYSGHANFGDVAQLKSIISWYKKRDFNVVVVIRLDAIYDEKFLEKLYEWFDVKAFIFYSSKAFNVEKYKLVKVKEFVCPNFHLYGGGMINRFWAKDIIMLCESIINKFQVTNYVVSGQQIDSYGAKLLKEHYNRFLPSVIGVRDRESLTYLRENGIEAYYSFDDAYEELEHLSTVFELVESDIKEVYLHFNLSAYVSDDLQLMIKTFVTALESIKYNYPNAKYKLLLTYLDSRILGIIDTLGVIGTLDYHFDMCEVTIVNLAALSLQSSCDNKIKIAKNSIVLATSYHTAMFMKILGMKVFMFAGNDYYEQKRKGLSLDKVSFNDLFKNDNSTEILNSKKVYREEWLRILSSHYTQHSIKPLEYKEHHLSETKLPIFKHKPIETNLADMLKKMKQ